MGTNASYNRWGIKLHYSNNNTISGNNASYNWWGILLYESNINEISGNNASYNDWGIYLDYSNNSEISENTATNNDYGICLINSKYDRVSRNILVGNIVCYSITGDCTGSTFETNNDCGDDDNCEDCKADDDNDEDDTSGGGGMPGEGKDVIAVIWDNWFLIIFGVAIGIALPSAYIIKSKKKKKEAEEHKKEINFKAKTNLKKEAMEQATWSSDKFKHEQATLELTIKSHAKGIGPKKNVQTEEIQLEGNKVLDKTKLKEIEQTEKEIALQEKLDVCTVHKGTIEGISYVCPKCHTKYCLKCAKTLKENNENCWVCDTKIALSKAFLDASQQTFDQKTDVKGKTTVKEDLDNKGILLAVSGKNGNDDLNILNKYNITAITKEEWEKIDRIDMDEEERETFVKELLTLTPQERVEVIEDIIQKMDLKGE